MSASTGKRRRRMAVLDKRYKKHSREFYAVRLTRKLTKMKEIASRKK